MPTIVPITPEERWQLTLDELPCEQPFFAPTVLLAPHPDDETLGAGGLVAKLCGRGIPVTVIAVTDGESAYADAIDLGEIRVREQTEALCRLGVPKSMIHRFQLPDREVAAHEEHLVERLMPLIEPGMHVIAPWQHDFHPDHEAVGRAAKRVARIKGAVVSYYLFWAWHRGTPDILDGLPVIKLLLTDAEVKTKIHALEAHASQFAHPVEQPILSSDLLRPAKRHYEVYIR